MANTQPIRTGSPPWSRKRIWLFRAAALSLLPGLLLLAELVCRLGGWNVPTDQAPPDPGFSRSRSLFVRNAAGDRYDIRKSRLKFFVPESFPTRKPERGFRIFCLGGSTVQGRPYGKETSFTSWLQLSLTAADPTRTWEVLNCGGVSYGSYRLIPILEECLSYEPDLFIVCTGHNEFLEERTFASIKRAPEILRRGHQALMHSRIYALLDWSLRRMLGKPPTSRPAATPRYSPEVDAFLDYRNGLQAYHRDPEWHRQIIEEYEGNLRQLIGRARQGGVPLLLVRPPSNLRDCPPFKSQHREAMSPSQLAAWTRLTGEARHHYQDDLKQAIRLLRQALRLDDQYAQSYYALGKCYEALGAFQSARQAFWRARELDVCPLRMLAELEQRLTRVATDTQTPLVDAHVLLEQQSRGQILGNDWLVDHIHPSIRGHQRIADALLEQMIQHRWVKPKANWQADRQQKYRAHLAGLDPLYFPHGQLRLQALQAWTQGRADGPPIETRLHRNATNAPSEQDTP